ncbi:MAG TPA: VOC family protein [Bdellovibrionota bacterium]|jgi:predicted enzyme related to lactoylglutathione lyase
MKTAYGTMYYVDDMDKAVAYYKKLGFEPSHQSPDWTEFPAGGHNICLHAKDKGKKHSPNGVLILSAKGTKKLFEKMKGDGLNVSDLKEVHPGAWCFTLMDNSSNELSVYGEP